MADSKTVARRTIRGCCKSNENVFFTGKSSDWTSEFVEKRRKALLTNADTSESGSHRWPSPRCPREAPSNGSGQSPARRGKHQMPERVPRPLQADELRKSHRPMQDRPRNALRAGNDDGGGRGSDAAGNQLPRPGRRPPPKPSRTPDRIQGNREARSSRNRNRHIAQEERQTPKGLRQKPPQTWQRRQPVATLTTFSSRTFEIVAEKKEKAGGVLLSHGRVPHYPRRWGP